MVQVKPKVRLTYDDLVNLPGDERYELIDGELILVGAPSEFHQSILLNLILLIQSVHRSLGRMYVPPFDVLLSQGDVVQPDLLFVSNERLDIVEGAYVRGAPDLVVEILSPSTARLDRTRKRALYERHGVKEMWLVDPDERTILVLTLRDGKLEVAGEYGEGQSFNSDTLGGLVIELDDVFRA